MAGADVARVADVVAPRLVYKVLFKPSYTGKTGADFEVPGIERLFHTRNIL